MPLSHAPMPGSAPEDIYRQCIENAPYGIRSTDPKGRIVLFNQRLVEITGYRPEDIPDIDTWCEKVYPDARYRRLVLRLRDHIWDCPPGRTGTEIMENMHAMITRKDGRMRNCRIRITLSPSGLRTAYIRDTHEPRPGGADSSHSSATLSESHRPFFTWIANGDEDFLLFGYNRAAETWAGKNLKDKLAAPVGEVFHDPAAIGTELRRCLANRMSVTCKADFRLRHHSETTYASAAYGFDPPCIVTLQIEDLTDLMRAESDLRQSEERFTELATLFPDIIYEIDPGGRISYINRNGAVLMGFDPGSYPKGDSAFNYFAPEDQERVRANLARTLAGENTGPNEYAMLRRDGTRFHALLRSSLVRKDGRVIGARGFIIDISARKQTEQALQASEQKFEISIRNTPNAFTINRMRDGMLMYVNDAACRLFGYAREDILGRTSRELATWVDPQLRTDVMTRLQTTPSVRNVPAAFHCKDEIRHGLYFAGLLEIDGELCVLQEVLDVTSLRQAEDALKMSEERLRMATEGAAVGLWDWDLVKRQGVGNDTYFRMLGYTPGQFTLNHENWLALVHPEDRTDALQKVKDCLIGGQGPYAAEYRMRHGDGAYRWILDTGRVAKRDTDGRPIRALGIHLDITERKHLEEIRRRSHDELERRVAERTSQLQSANRKLKQQVRQRMSAEDELRAGEQLLRRKSEDLAETNAALRVLLKKRDEDQQDIQKSVLTHVTRTVTPYLEKLKQQKQTAESRQCLAAIAANLNDLAASSVRKLSDNLFNLTPAELQIAGLIMMDKATKEIAEDLNLSPKTVEYHRYNLRRKLGLGKRQVNLRAYLKTIK